MTGGAGIDAVSSAQSKRMGGGETARLGLGRDELGWMGGGPGVFVGIDNVVGDDGGV